MGALGQASPRSDALNGDITPPLSSEERAAALRLSPLPALPANPTNRYADDPAAAAFGRTLFFEQRLSGDQTRSCASCHEPARAFADGRPLPDAPQAHDRNTPTLLNVAHHRWFFSDGSADTLWAQALRPMESGRELASNRARISRLILTDAELRAAYERVFGPPPRITALDALPAGGVFDARPAALAGETAAPENAELYRAWDAISSDDQSGVSRVFANVGKALEAYQRRLMTGPAPFDEFIAGLRENDIGRLRAISPSAVRGLKLFLGRANCTLCHSGPLFSDREFHNIGVPDRDTRQVNDPGRFAGIELVQRDPFNGLGAFSDAPDSAFNDKLRFLAQPPHAAGAFKTPSLRNVALTAPYMRQGQFKSLEEVVEFYSTLEGAAAAGHGHRETILQPLNLTAGEKADLVAFLRTLTGAPPPAEWLSADGKAICGE